MCLLAKDTPYLRYFDWHLRTDEKNQYLGGSNEKLQHYGFCGLCHAIHESQYFEPIPDLTTWWFGARNMLTDEICVLE